ncbi:inosose dehydratase [Salipiger aestuarii]|uniref:Inosose dehydratase n=1 Tax=Salipiger aestuarii TaxID=568098 RepID=A0A327YF00_9RHOB|nr:myo-inosose-2 dehydratase [Salipiger aestuarii]EIE49284.1 inosose dehydratase [Citreicella sp. 357]KAA8608846.1 inosose dehydratase [Salipiger aestuarii]KAA8613151.1 inosose dehydratase [Salipiger aestuarii]KAB2542993.1 inosose dehydratase [Salipiger aestuarii]RAK19628.1 inosose dehydratase [Salipiger aestuarii]
MLNPDKVLVGITPTGWTNDDYPSLGEEISFGQCVTEMALAGFSGCSVGHKFPKDPDILERELSQRGLRVSEPWSSTFFTVNDMHDRTIESFRDSMAFIKRMGGTSIVVAELGHAVHQQPVPPIANKPHFDDAQWDSLTTGLNDLGRIAADAEMRLCYHHHMGTGVMTRPEVDRLMAETDAEVVHLLLDTGHLYWAGDDPLAMARAYADRIRHVHLKDIRHDVMDRCNATNRTFIESVMQGVFTVPGDGVIDFAPIFQALADADYAGWLMVEAEQDPAKANPLQYARMARAYIRETAGV